MVFIFESRCQPGLWSSEGLAWVGGSARVGVGGGPGSLPSVPFYLLFVSFHKMAADFSQSEWSKRAASRRLKYPLWPALQRHHFCNVLIAQASTTQHQETDPWQQFGRLATTGPAEGLLAEGLGLESRALNFPVCFFSFISFNFDDKICITYFFKKIGDTKGAFHANIGTIKGKNGQDLAVDPSSRRD